MIWATRRRSSVEIPSGPGEAAGLSDAIASSSSLGKIGKKSAEIGWASLISALLAPSSSVGESGVVSAWA